jgi:hypothetical protein
LGMAAPKDHIELPPTPSLAKFLASTLRLTYDPDDLGEHGFKVDGNGSHVFEAHGLLTPRPVQASSSRDGVSRSRPPAPDNLRALCEAFRICNQSALECALFSNVFALEGSFAYAHPTKHPHKRHVYTD